MLLILTFIFTFFPHHRQKTLWFLLYHRNTPCSRDPWRLTLHLLSHLIEFHWSDHPNGIWSVYPPAYKPLFALSCYSIAYKIWYIFLLANKIFPSLTSSPNAPSPAPLLYPLYASFWAISAVSPCCARLLIPSFQLAISWAKIAHLLCHAKCILQDSACYSSLCEHVPPPMTVLINLLIAFTRSQW